MRSEETVLELIRLIYAAAAGEEQWDAFLGAFARVVSSPSAALIVQDLTNLQGNVSASRGVDPYWQKLYDEHYCTLNYWARRLGHLYNPGTVLNHGMLQGDMDRELAATEFYNDYLGPQKLFYAFGGVITQQGPLTSQITSLRSKAAGPYRQEETAILQTLMPHLQTATRIHARLASLDRGLVSAQDALDCMPWGVIALRSDGSVIWLNRAAERLLARRDGLWHDRHGLHAASNRETEILRAAISSASQTGRRVTASGTVLSISRPSSRPLSLLIAPSPIGRFRVRETAVLIFVGDPEEKLELEIDDLKQLLGLTSAEAALALALLSGKSLKQYAEESHVTLNTVRTHMKRILHKTGSSRQSELIRLLSGSAARLRRTSSAVTA